MEATKRVVHDGARPEDRSYSRPSEADQVTELLRRAGLSQNAGARALEINERTMRRYASGQLPTPRVVILALERLVDMQRAVSST